MSWHVSISQPWDLFQTRIYIWKIEGEATHILHMEKGNTRMDPWPQELKQLERSHNLLTALVEKS